MTPLSFLLPCIALGQQGLSTGQTFQVHTYQAIVRLTGRTGKPVKFIKLRQQLMRERVEEEKTVQLLSDGTLSLSRPEGGWTMIDRTYPALSAFLAKKELLEIVKRGTLRDFVSFQEFSPNLQSYIQQLIAEKSRGAVCKPDSVFELTSHVVVDFAVPGLNISSSFSPQNTGQTDDRELLKQKLSSHPVAWSKEQADQLSKTNDESPTCQFFAERPGSLTSSQLTGFRTMEAWIENQTSQITDQLIQTAEQKKGWTETPKLLQAKSIGDLQVLDPQLYERITSSAQRLSEESGYATQDHAREALGKAKMSKSPGFQLTYELTGGGTCTIQIR